VRPTITKVSVALLIVSFIGMAVFVDVPPSRAATSTLSVGEVATPPIPALNPLNPTSDFNLVGIIYDYMFSLNWPPLAYTTPVMAGGYSSNADGTQWVISLRPNLKWSNGTPLNATDLVYTLNVDNQSGFFSPAITGLNIVNSTSVQINLGGPATNFIYTGFISNGFAVLPKQTFGKVAFADLTSYTNVDNIVASGPFTLTSYSGQNPVVLQANPYYWNGAPKVQTLNYYMYTSQSAYFNAYIAGQIDILSYVGAYTGLQSVANLQGHSLISPPYATPGLTVGAYLNDWVYPTNVTAFRQALAYATNVTQINSELNGPYANKSASTQDFLLPAYNQQIGFNATGPHGYSYNVATAKQILQANGFKYSGSTLQYPNGTAVSLTLKFRTNEPYSQSVATLLASQWSQLGMTITPVIVPSATLRAGANNPVGWQVIVCGVLGPQTNTGVTPGPGVLADLGDYFVNINGTHTSWNSTYYTVWQRLATETPGTPLFNADARNLATSLAINVPIIPFFNVNNWSSVNDNFYWGNPANSTGVYYTQAITQMSYWALGLDAVSPASAGTSSTTSSTQTSSSSTSPAGGAPDYTTYYLLAGVAIVVIVVVAVAVSRRGRAGPKAA
jgi:peptide/nickel transport system substrate-binding protein